MKLCKVLSHLVMGMVALYPLATKQVFAADSMPFLGPKSNLSNVDEAGLLSLSMDASHLYLMGDDGTLTVLSYDGEVPVVLSTTASSSQPDEIALHGTYLAAAEGVAGIELFDVSDPNSPQMVGAIQSVEGYPDFEADGVEFGTDGTLLVASGDNVHLFSIGDDNSAVHLGAFVGDRTARDLTVSGDLLGIGNRGFGFNMVDVSDPSSPEQLSLWSDRADQVTFVGTHAFTAGEEFEAAVLRVIDINPELEEPSELGSHETYAGYDGEFTIPELVVEEEGTFAAYPFMWEHGDGSVNYGIFVYDTSVPSETDQVAQLNLPAEPTDAALYGQTMAVTFGMRVVLYDLTDPSNPVELSGYSTSVDDPSGNVVLPRSPVIESIYPNPFNASTRIVFQLPASEQVRLAVYDMLGRERLLLTDQVYGAGQHSLSLETGHFSSGTYIVRLQTAQYQTAKKLVLVK